MIDIFTVVVPHVLMAIAVWRLLARDDLDVDPILPSIGRLIARGKSSPTSRPEDKPGA